MTYKEAIQYLQPVADSTPLVGYGGALRAALQAMQEVESLRAELEDERYRHDRYVDYAVERDRMMDRMKEGGDG